MSRVTFIWALVFGACVTMALPHLLIGMTRRAWENLLFAIAALAVAGVVVGELAIMRSRTPEEIGRAIQWIHLPLFFLFLGMIGFVWAYFGTGRLWLGIAGCGVRFVALVINFASAPNLNFREITGLRHFDFLGEMIAMPEGVVSPWTRLGELSSLLMLAFVIDASLVLWHRGGSEGRRRALVVGGSITLFIVLAAGWSALIHAKALQMPYLISFPFLGVILAMGFELSNDILRAAKIARQLRVSESALRESEVQMGLAAAAGNLGLWIWNISQDEVWLSEKGRALSGFTNSKLLNLGNFLEAIHDDDRERMRQLVQSALAGEGEYESEYRITRQNGETRWVFGYGRVEFDQHGKALVMRGVIRDITKRKLAEEASRESEGRFRTVADVSPVMIWMSDTSKQCTFFNKGWLDFTGRRLEQELGNGWAEGVHPEDFERCLDVYVSSFDARQTFRMEYRLRRHDGEYRWLLDTGTPRFTPDGAFLGYIGACLDITERRHAEERFRLVLDAAPNAMIMVDSAGVISFANAPAATVFGYADNELIGSNIETLIPARFRDRHPGHRKGFLSEPSSRAMGAGSDLFGRRKDGSEFLVEVGLNPIRTAEGMFVLASVLDITARKQAELEHQRQNMELARVGRVAVMGELAASLAHEVNNPIGAIVANASAGQRLIAAGKMGLPT